MSKKKSIDIFNFKATFEHRHENKSCSACLKAQQAQTKTQPQTQKKSQTHFIPSCWQKNVWKSDRRWEPVKFSKLSSLILETCWTTFVFMSMLKSVSSSSCQVVTLSSLILGTTFVFMSDIRVHRAGSQLKIEELSSTHYHHPHPILHLLCYKYYFWVYRSIVLLFLCSCEF